MNRTPHRLLPALLIIIPALLQTHPTQAITLSGRWLSSAYTSEHAVSDSLSERHLPAYQGLSLNIGQLAGGKGELRTYILGHRDFLAQGAGNYLKLSHLYFRLRDIGGLASVTLGRQFAYAGVARGMMDGLRLDLRLPVGFKLRGYAGAIPVLDNGLKLNSWSRSNMVGGRLALPGIKGTVLAVSYVRKNKNPIAYGIPGAFSLRETNYSSLREHLLGIDVQSDLPGSIRLSGRLDHNLELKRTRRLILESSYRHRSGFDIRGYFMSREPYVYPNSIFSVFSQQPYKEAGGRVGYRLSPTLRVYGGVSRVFFRDENSTSLNVGASLASGYLSYSRRIGYSGEANSLTLGLKQPLRPGLWALADVNYSNYQLYEDSPKFDAVWAGVGVSVQPVRNATIDFQIQRLNNRVYQSDYRFLARSQVWFFRK
ncbi:hypothetical protein ACFLT7_03840 [candidate division KSB1 bacterium]